MPENVLLFVEGNMAKKGERCLSYV
jgi:hypothetical protein